MRNTLRKTALASATLVAISAVSSAQAELRINGFANLTAGMTTNDTEVYGFNDKVNFSDGSLFALQVSGQVNEKVSATAQILSRGADNYSAEFEWAYLTYNIDSNNNLSAGRFRLPLFRYSESLDVGYSYHWITAPRSVYNVPFNNINGIRFDHTGMMGDWDYAFQISAGEYSESVSGGTVTADALLAASFEASYEFFKVRLVTGRGNNNFSQAAVDSTVGALRPIAPALADSLALEDDSSLFLGAGFEYDNFNWFVSGEYTSVEIEDSFSPQDVAWYITAGKRFGKWTPHITYETRDGNQDIKFLDQIAAFPAEFQPSLTGAVAGLQGFFMEEFSILTVGARYDWDASIALKAEISRYDNKLDDIAGDINNAEDTNLINLSVNYIF
ncbi:porin [Ningiella sp. W23]|uniref:porin n=1 Tax=Ningiella sp. W23 TaxID=3023715 RepID=UPI0037564FEA